jgi:hypothetical protein
VRASTPGGGDAGSVFVRVAGGLTTDGTETGAILLAQSFSANVGGGLTISAGSIRLSMVDQSAHSTRDEPLSPSLPLQTVRTRQPLTRSPPTSVLTTPSTPTSIRERRYCRHLSDRANCAAVLSYYARLAPRSDRPISSLVEAGRGGLRQDPEATLPALYIADRDVNPKAMPDAGTTEADRAALQTTVHLTMRCGG